jgi:hypothetical protein
MLFMAHANNTDCGLRARDGAAMRYALFVWRMILSENRSPPFGIMRVFVWGMALSENRFTLFRAMP